MMTNIFFDFNFYFFILFFLQIRRIGSDELMGYVGIGTNVIGTGRDHWLDMLDNPRNPVAQWYTLMDSEPGPIPTSDSFRFNCLNGRYDYLFF